MTSNTRRDGTTGGIGLRKSRADRRTSERGLGQNCYQAQNSGDLKDRVHGDPADAAGAR